MSEIRTTPLSHRESARGHRCGSLLLSRSADVRSTCTVQPVGASIVPVKTSRDGLPRACRDATASFLLSIYADMRSVAFLNHRLTPASIASWNAKAHAAYTSSFQAVVDRGGFVWNLMRDADNNMALTGGVVPQPINATCKSWMLSKCGNSSWDGASWSVTQPAVPYRIVDLHALRCASEISSVYTLLCNSAERQGCTRVCTAASVGRDTVGLIWNLPRTSTVPY